MPLTARLSILGLYNYDKSIFDDFNVPEGMDKETAIETIFSECNDLEIIYPNPYTMKVAIKLWTKAELPIWERMYKDTLLEYNPLWNVDGTETRTIETIGTTKNLGKEDSTENIVGSNKASSKEVGTSKENSTTNGENESIDSVKGYNESEWAESNKNNGTATNTNETKSETSSQIGNESETTTINTGEKTSENNGEHYEKVTDTFTRGGNIGVTMTQQLINADLDMLPRFDIYKYICESFKYRFTVEVY